MDVTDDKTLGKSECKQCQIEHAAHISDQAKLVKLADKISNLRDVASTGSYDRVAAFARVWRQEPQEAKRTAVRNTFVPLSFAPGEAFQFDWSEDYAVINGVNTKLQVAHFKLSHSRAFFLRAYLLQSHEMLFDAHYHGHNEAVILNRIDEALSEEL